MAEIGRKRNFHQARWDEPLIMEMGNPGERGIVVCEVEPAVDSVPAEKLVPAVFLRKTAPKLPELSQMQVLRHFLRLSQETIGADLNIDVGLGTCTMKYSPKIHEEFVRSAKMAEIHPCQDDSTLQGILEIMYKTAQYLKEISGLDHFCLQPSGGTQAIYSNVSIMRAYHEENGEGLRRDEVITTMLSHPGNPSAAATAGYKVVTLMPGPDGLTDLDALKKAVSWRTAGLLITNPEDTGLYNPRIREITDIVHAAGGLCIYDQANLNGLFCLTRAKDAGFDMCHYNLHKSFSSPHGCQGPGAGAQGVVAKLAKYLPLPQVCFDGNKYYLQYDCPDSIGKLRKFHGNPAVALRAYAYIRSLGQEGLRQVAELSILNNNYLLKKLLAIKGLSLPYGMGAGRLEQARLSWQDMAEETGVTTDDICRRVVDYGFQGYFSSHHPRVVPEPFTPEPTETYSKDDIDEYIDALKSIAEECRSNPQMVKNAPCKAALATRIDEECLTEIGRFATTWRAYRKYVQKCLEAK
jgi:glycine dehydrogenase subunit 2